MESLNNCKDLYVFIYSGFNVWYQILWNLNLELYLDLSNSEILTDSFWNVWEVLEDFIDILLIKGSP